MCWGETHSSPFRTLPVAPGASSYGPPLKTCPASCRLPPLGTQKHIGGGGGDRGPRADPRGCLRLAACLHPKAVFSTQSLLLVPSASGVGTALLLRAQLPAFSVAEPNVSPVSSLLTGLSSNDPGSGVPFLSYWDPDTPWILSCHLCAKNTVTYTHVHRKCLEGYTETVASHYLWGMELIG